MPSNNWGHPILIMANIVKPLKAATLRNINDLAPHIKRGGLVASPKIDGIRGLLFCGVFYSCSGKPLPNKKLQDLGKKLFTEYGLDALDGEIVATDADRIQDTDYNTTQSAVMSRDYVGPLSYTVFDIIAQGKFDTRYETLWKEVATKDIREVKVLEQQYVCYLERAREIVASHLALGFEGTMFRSLDAYYKHGRSTLREGALIKFKQFLDAEAIVTGVEPLYENYNTAETSPLGYTVRSSAKAGKVATDKLGALICSSPEFPNIHIGSGFTEAERYDLWANPPIGKTVTYKYFNYGTQEAPRHPVFLRFRDPTV